MSEPHVHDCTGPDMRCPCGYVFRIPPVCVGLDITVGSELVISEGFNCETLEGALEHLYSILAKLRYVAVVPAE